METSRFGAPLQDHKPTIVARSPIKALPVQAHSMPNFNRYGNIEDDIRIPAPTPVKQEAVVEDDDALSYFASLASDD